MRQVLQKACSCFYLPHLPLAFQYTSMLRAVLLLLVCVLVSSQQLAAQLHKSHWYFGIDSGIRFENGEPISDPNTNPNSYGGCVSMSDSSGNLLFFTSRRTFYNRNFEVMQGSNPVSAGLFFDAIALPSPIETGVYFVYIVFGYNLEIYKVDMKKAGGLGEVTLIGDFVPTDAHFLRGITAVKSCQSNSYWLLAAYRAQDNTNAWVSYKVDISSGFISQNSVLPIDAEVSLVPHELITSSNGEYIVYISTESSHIAEFDPRCGRFIKSTQLNFPEDDLVPRGACFSPNDDYLYLTFSGGLLPIAGRVYQVDHKNLNAPDPFGSFMNTPYSLYGLLAGPDKRLYIMTENEPNGLKVMDRIENPDMPLSNITYSAAVVPYANQNSAPFLPNFVNDTRSCSEATSPGINKTFFCVDDSISLQLSELNRHDSIFLIDRSLGKYYAPDSLNKISLPDKSSGIHKYELVWTFCDETIGKKTVDIRVYDYPVIPSFDTTICTGDSFSLPAPDVGLTREVAFNDQGQWLPYTEDYVHQKGAYRTVLKNAACTSTDSFDVDITPPLLTSLGDTFAFCEKEGIPIILDAGKGFEGYKWYPTNDRTQWIKVRQTGDYYVVVNDSRGCTGRGDAKVYSDCEPRIFIPNAFSPNGNNINDSFCIKGKYIVPLSLSVYDRWGAIVHYAQGAGTAWNGTKNGEHLPNGTYVYLLQYRDEYSQKVYTLSGSVHLLR